MKSGTGTLKIVAAFRAGLILLTICFGTANSCAADETSSATRPAQSDDSSQGDDAVVLPKEEVTAPRIKPSLAPNLGVEDASVEAIVAMVHRQYTRSRLSDGSFRPETYIFSKPAAPAGTKADPSVDHISWNELTGEIAAALAHQNYFLAKAPSNAELRIKIEWGTSELPETGVNSGAPPIPEILNLPPPPSSANSADWARKNVDGQSIMGRYRAPVDAGLQLSDSVNRLGFPDLTARYFVIVSAYENVAKPPEVPLWETHFSVAVDGNRFDQQLTALAFGAADFFGQDSDGIVRQPLSAAMFGRHAIAANSSALRFAKGNATLAPDGAHVAILRDLVYTQQIVIVSVSNPEHSVNGEIAVNAEMPLNIHWEDSAHLLVAKTPTTWIRFDLAEKRTELVAGSLQPAVESSDSTSRLVAFGEVRKIAEEKLPDREVTILGSDRTNRRFLLLASPATGARRYFVLDRPSDLLYEVAHEQVAREESK